MSMWSATLAPTVQRLLFRLLCAFNQLIMVPDTTIYECSAVLFQVEDNIYNASPHSVCQTLTVRKAVIQGAHNPWHLCLWTSASCAV
ncbi:hypothetical protein CBR_g28553 [Chara braunii]|uniref:Secreted protein n=1 Tax=Chara braunii TaxID=69332 RepID=A0A388JWD2_CHABU|nr:hypothetical protein CBR_g28553 [Chara braunii]|eukprot:GBG62077.1 hypothetical protein CBR_g28553 [Chara braunii]